MNSVHGGHADCASDFPMFPRRRAGNRFNLKMRTHCIRTASAMHMHMQ